MRTGIALLMTIAAGCSRMLPGIPSSAAHSQPACVGVAITPGDAATVQRVLNRYPGGTTFCFAPGTYRFAAPIVPKNGQRLIATARGTILNGAKVVTGFTRSGSDYVAPAFLHGAHFSSRNCIVPQSGCDTRQDAFFDAKPLRRVTSVAALAPNTFYEDFARNRIWLHDNPAEHTVEQAYATALVQSGRGGIAVIGFVIEEAASPAQLGAVNALNYVGRGWDIERDVVRNNHAAGIFLGPVGETQGGSTVSSNVIAGNGQEGIAGYGAGHIISDNDIAYNNRVGYSCYWECGGAKFGAGNGLETEHLSVTGNRVHDNAGDGFWVDINSYDVTFSRNIVLDNWQRLPSSAQRIGAGIFIEISDRATISSNDVERNGPTGTSTDQSNFYQGAQILISASANVDVGGNHVTGAGGIGMLQQDRNDSCTFGRTHAPSYPDGTPVCPYHYDSCKASDNCISNNTHWTHDNRIHDNRIDETAGPGYAEVAGLDCDLSNDAPAFAAKNANRYFDNVYSLPVVDGTYFSWNNVLNTSRQWRSFGQDAGSRF